jgi:gliding motility-associated-like protein
MKKIIFCLAFSLFIHSIFAQSNFFNKKFAQSNVVFENTVSTPDAGALAMGYYGNIRFLSKLDSIGNIQWAKKSGFKDFDFIFTNFEMNKDKNIVFSCAEANSTASSVVKSRLIKMDATMSNVIWTLENEQGISQIYTFTTLKNGNIVVPVTVPEIYPEYRLVIYTFSPDGDLIWQKSFKQPTTLDYTEVNKIVELKDGQLLLVSSVFNGTKYTNQPKNRLCKMNAIDGSIIWQTEYSSVGNQYENLNFVDEDEEGNLYFSFYGFVYPFYELAQSGFCKITKDGNVVWLKQLGKQPLNIQSIAAKPDGTFIANMIDYQVFHFLLNINKKGEITSQFREILQAGNVKVCHSTNESILIVKNTLQCGTNTGLFIERRANDGKGRCSETSDVSTTDLPFAKSNYYSNLFPVPNTVNGFKKVTTFPLSNVSLSTQEKVLKCQDTVFVNRCEGGSYTVGKNIYTKTGVYTDVIKSQSCFKAVISKLNIVKKDIVKIDTVSSCGEPLEIGKVVYTQSGTYQRALFNKFGCDSIVTLNIVISKPKSSIDTTICEGKTLKIGTKEFTQAGVYKEVLKNKLGCDSTVSLQLKIKKIEITTPDTIAITEGEEANLNATSLEKNLIYEWSPPDDLTCVKCPKTIAKPSETIDYTVKGTRKDGCEAEAKINVKVFKRGEVFIPTAFSPDDNGTNDFFTVFGNQGVAKILDYSIFDRWGNQVFNQKNVLPNDPIAGWNGSYKNERVQQGIYIYKIQIEMANGKIRDYSGDVMVN